MSIATAVRTIDGLELPAAGTWVIDSAHSSVEVVARHLVISKVRGRFTRFSGRIHVAELPEESSVNFSIDAASIHTADERRDEHLRSPDFLDTANHPEITFASTSVSAGRKAGHWTVTGDLGVRGVTRQVSFDVALDGVGSSPDGSPRLVVSSQFEVDREEFGLTWNVALETGGVLVGRQLRIELSIQALPDQAR